VTFPRWELIHRVLNRIGDRRLGSRRLRSGGKRRPGR
jgi:hypothetical protein